MDRSAWTERDRRYWPVVAAIAVVALGLRLFQLEVPIFMHDEAIYAIFSHNFHEYNFDPVYHGPTLYHIIKGFFLAAGLFVTRGDNDWSARFVSVVMGMITLWMVIGPARRWLGARGALWGMALLALSPVMVTYQRRILFDAWVVVLTLGCVLTFQNAIAARRGSWSFRASWLGLAALLTTFLATKANAFFVVAMLASFWVLTFVRGLGPRNWIVPLPRQLPIILFVAVSIASVMALRDENKKMNELMLQVVSVVACALLWEWLRRTGPDVRPAKKGEAPPPPAAFALPRPDWATIGLCVLVSVLLFSFFFGHGANWGRASYSAFKCLTSDSTPAQTSCFATFKTYGNDILQAMPRMLAYWGGQQKEPRLPGRHDFYLPMMILYELPILIAAIAGIIRASARRTRFADLMLWWTFTTYVLYSIANEKVPWLMTHLVLPFALIGGWWLGQLRFDRPLARRIFAAACVVSVVYLLRNISASNYERAIDNREPMFYAFTSESFRDTYYKALEVTKANKDKPGDIWVYNAWPPSWLLRHAGEDFPGTAVHYTETLPNTTSPFKMVVCQEADWGKHQDKFAGFTRYKWEKGRGVVTDGMGENPYILAWPRPSWISLRPDLWFHWWLTREARLPKDVADPKLGDRLKPFLTEWSHIPVVVGTAP